MNESKVAQANEGTNEPRADAPESGTQTKAEVATSYEPTDEQISHVVMRMVGCRNDEREPLSIQFREEHPEIGRASCRERV